MGAIGNVTAGDAAHRQSMATLQVRLAVLEEASQQLRDRATQQDTLSDTFQSDLRKLSEQQLTLSPKSIMTHPSVQKLLDQKVSFFFLFALDSKRG